MHAESRLGHHLSTGIPPEQLATLRCLLQPEQLQTRT